MNSIAWWTNVVVLLLASGIDIRTRRAPNWLTLPFLLSGLTFQIITGGAAGAGRSLAGVGLATALFGVLCLLRGMGMGDLKLAAGVGAWIGPQQFVTAFVVTGIVGGVIGVVYALWRGALGTCLDNTGELLIHLVRRRGRPHPQLRLENPNALSIPYVPVIAFGTLFSFFAQ